MAFYVMKLVEIWGILGSFGGFFKIGLVENFRGKFGGNSKKASGNTVTESLPILALFFAKKIRFNTKI